MGSEDSAPPAAPEPIGAPPPRKLGPRRKKKLIIALAILIPVLIILFWGWDVTGNFLSVSDLLENQADYEDDTVEVQGLVDDWYGYDEIAGEFDSDFMLCDLENNGTRILVHMNGTFPADFSTGSTAIVTGVFRSSPTLMIEATEISLSCSSKY